MGTFVLALKVRGYLRFQVGEAECFADSPHGHFDHHVALMLKLL